MQKRLFLSWLTALAAGSTVKLASASTTSASSASTSAAGKRPARIAFVYFSKTGHTESVALAAQAMTGCDIFAVRTVEPYPEQYRPTTEVVKRELEEGIVRPIVPPEIDLSKYDIVCLGTPTWWHHVAMPLQSWIKTQNFAGKRVLTCNTHGGGGIMHTREDFEALLANSKARLGTHLTVYGGVSKDDADVRKWLEANGVPTK